MGSNMKIAKQEAKAYPNLGWSDNQMIKDIAHDAGVSANELAREINWHTTPESPAPASQESD